MEPVDEVSILITFSCFQNLYLMIFQVTAVQGTTMDADGKVAQTPIKIFVKSRKNTPQALSQNIASPHASPVATTPALPPQSLVVKSTQEVS